MDWRTDTVTDTDTDSEMGGRMSKPFFSILTIIILTASCSSTTVVDKDFFVSPDGKPVIGLVSFQTQYVRSTSGAFLGKESGNISIEGDDEYKAALDEKCLKVIAEVLKSKSATFSFDAGPFTNMPQLENLDVLGLENVNMDEDVIKKLKEEAKSRNVKLIRKFIKENGLDGAIRIESRYTHVEAGFKLAVQTFWTIYNSEGDTVLFVESASIDEESRSFAYMMDTKLENEIISLTKENAKKLILAILKG